MSIDDQLLEYKRKIKEWEKSFQGENGRLPSKNDVKANKDIRRAYKTYNQLKEKVKQARTGKSKEEGNAEKFKTSKHSETSQHEKLPSQPEFKPLNVSIDTDDELSETEAEMPVANAEFGPTPQANGKVLSIFDMVLSPPESSPLKLKQQLYFQLSPVKMRMESQVFKTPTKAVKKIEYADLTPSKSSGGKTSLMAQLRQASSPQKPRMNDEPATPTKNGSGPLVETPFYLGKVNNKFLFNKLSESPVADVFTTPTKPSNNTFQVSPSPLKPQRMFSLTRSVSEIFNDNRNIDFEELEAQKLEIEKDLDTIEDEEEDTTEQAPFTRKRKAITQKRTTRRWKIKPNANLDQEDAFEGKDVHEEIKKLDDDERKAAEAYVNGTEIHDNDEEDPDLVKLVPRVAKAGRKLKPISDNFKRHKINDPRTKKFKQRMRRR